MKRLLPALLLLIASPSFAQFVPYSLRIEQMGSDGISIWGRFFVPSSPTTTGFLIYDGSTSQPKIADLNSTLTWNGTTLGVSSAATPVNADWNSSSGLSQILNKPLSRGQASASRSLNSAFQISATRDTLATYSVQITVTASIAGGQNGDVILEIASNSGFTTDVQTLSIAGLGQTYTLAVALQGVQPQTSVVSGYVPAGYYARLRTVNNTGTPGFSFRAGQEVSL